jgi:Mg-chelatase subunit ChlD
MNPDSPIDPRSALEANLTALLLGELPHEQAAALHQKLAQDAELAKLYERLKQTINLVRETVASPAAQTADQPTPLKLSDERRQKLLQQFKTVAPKQFARPRRRAREWLVPVGIAAALVVMVAATLVPNFVKARNTSMAYYWRSTGRESEATERVQNQDAAPAPAIILLASKSEGREAGSPATPPAPVPPPEPARPAGTAIVLSKSGELADATTATTVAEGVQPGFNVSGTIRGFYDDESLGRAGGMGGGGYGGGGGAAAGRGGRPTEVAGGDSFLGKMEQVDALEAGKPVNETRERQALGERVPPPTVVESTGYAQQHKADGSVPTLGANGEPLPTPPQSQNFKSRQANVVLPPAIGNGTLETPAPAVVPPLIAAATPVQDAPAAARPIARSREIAGVPLQADGRFTKSSDVAAGGLVLPGGPATGPRNAGEESLKFDAARWDSADKLADTTATTVTKRIDLFGVTEPLNVTKSTPATPSAGAAPEPQGQPKLALAGEDQPVPSGSRDSGVAVDGGWTGAGAMNSRDQGGLAQNLPALHSPKEGGQAGGSGGAATAPATANPQEMAANMEAFRRRYLAVPSAQKPAGDRTPTPGAIAPSVAGAAWADGDNDNFYDLFIQPPGVDSKAKAAETSQDKQKALGFDWYLGNTVMRDGQIAAQDAITPFGAGQASVAGKKPEQPLPPSEPASTAGLVPLELKLPAPAFAGTPRNLPVLGDVPLTGRLFRNGGSPATPLADGKQDGAAVAQNTLGLLPKDAVDKSRLRVDINAIYANQSSAQNTDNSKGDHWGFFGGQTQDDAGALFRYSLGKDGDKVKSVEWNEEARSQAPALIEEKAIDQLGTDTSGASPVTKRTIVLPQAAPETSLARLDNKGSINMGQGFAYSKALPDSQSARVRDFTIGAESAAAAPSATDQQLASGLRSGDLVAFDNGSQKGLELGRESLARKKSASESEKVAGSNAGPQVYALNVVGYVDATPSKNLLAQRELDELHRFRQVLDAKIAGEKTDVALPKTMMVEIVDKAVPASSPSSTLWEKIRGKTGDYKSTARIKVERDQTDISSMMERGGMVAYDPYFVQNEEELIQSEAILGKVAEDLNLKEAWAKKKGTGDKLTTAEAVTLLKQSLDLHPVKGTSLLEIGAKSDKPEEAAKIANAVADAYTAHRAEQRASLSKAGVKALEERRAEQDQKIASAKAEVERLERQAKESASKQADVVPPKSAAPAPIPQPEVQTAESAFSTFSLNVSDVSFKLAGASLEKGVMPEPANVRSEEFINAFDYRDPEPPPGVPVAFAWERAQYPFAQNRDLLRFSVKTAALGRQPGRPLNLVLLLDNSGSMERADRVRIIQEALRVLAGQLQPQDKFSVVTFSRTAHLWVDGVPGNQAGQVAEQVSGLTPQGGTNLEDAMNLAYQTALRHYLANGVNRVVLLTDGAANLGNVEPEALKQKVEAHRKQGVALDCFGIGWEGYNDDLLEVLSRNGDGRYGFVNTPEEAATEFAGQLAGALHVAASDVKVQVEFNPARVTAYRQIGYAKHQLTKEQFRDNTVDAAEIAAAESGNALYTVEVNPNGAGPLGTVRVRYKVPGTSDYREQAWDVPFNGNAVALDQASPAMRLAATASALSEWLVSSPYAGEVTPDRLLGYLKGVPEVYGADARPKKLEWMIRQAKSIAGK